MCLLPNIYSQSYYSTLFCLAILYRFNFTKYCIAVNSATLQEAPEEHQAILTDPKDFSNTGSHMLHDFQDDDFSDRTNLKKEESTISHKDHVDTKLSDHLDDISNIFDFANAANNDLTIDESNTNEAAKTTNHERNDVTPQQCHWKQYMSYDECSHYVTCPTTCNNGDDCTFPYCDSIGQCQCREGKRLFYFSFYKTN